MEVQYKPPGPVAQTFHLSNDFVRGLMGPVGSGKSSSCCYEILIRSLQQQPYQGVRRSRWAAVRNTYPELKSTTIRTWDDWFGQIAPIKWDSPISSMIRIPNIGDGTGLELEVLFIAIDRPEDVGKLKSLELTGAWMNEAVEMEKGILDMLTQRVGRFPSLRAGGPSWSGVILDTNPPDDDHWWYELAEEQNPKGFSFYRQPGGLYRDEKNEYHPNPTAENVFNLPGGYEYYLRQVAGKRDEWINVFLLGNYGTTAEGKPVYPEWNDKIHVAKEEIKPVIGLPILLGWDFGLTPSCIIGQVSPRGTLMILQEVLSEDMGIRQFANDIVKPVLMNKYQNHRLISVGDPAGSIRVQTDERTCFQELSEAGIPSMPSDTNDFIPRREAVAFYLTKLADGVPAFQLNPACSVLRKGFNGKYHYERVKTSGPTRYKDRPRKDEYSHPHDALQYLAMKVRSGMNPVRAKPVVNTDRMKAYT